MPIIKIFIVLPLELLFEPDVFQIVVRKAELALSPFTVNQRALYTKVTDESLFLKVLFVTFLYINRG